MRLVIHATNVHQGGGRTLLLGLLAALRQPAIVLLDTRLTALPALDPQVEVRRVAPRLGARLRAERQLQALCQPGMTLLCFGNLPPLFPTRARVFVYLQNRYLSAARPLSGLPWRIRMRILIERAWLRSCLRDARLLVQTEVMAQEVRDHLKRDCTVLPFFPPSALAAKPDAGATGVHEAPGSATEQYDFVYVASGEPHKNHRRLIEAWQILAARNCRPSLCLTLDPQRDRTLLGWIEQQARQNDLHVVNRIMTPDQIVSLYAGSGALLYPSLFESFGLPLLEARAASLPIVAAERDYVRELVVPTQSFDPESALSIARAVLRHLDLAPAPVFPSDAARFLQQLALLD